jgi:Tol biopolymer transport system component
MPSLDDHFRALTRVQPPGDWPDLGDREPTSLGEPPLRRRFAVAALALALAVAGLALAVRAFTGGTPPRPGASPDEARIAYVTGHGASTEIHIVGEDGSGDERLVGGRAPSWSPDGTRIAFRTGDPEKPGTEMTISVVDVDGTGGRVIAQFQGEPQNPGAPTWSPDGTMLAFATNGIYVVNVDGTDLQLVTRYDGERTCADLEPSWSPDGSSIAFAVRCEGGDEGIWLVDADGTDRRQLLAPNEELVSLSFPAWSPDGSKIAFAGVSGGPTEFEHDIYVMTADGSDITKLTEALGFPTMPTWSPDGSRIALLDWSTDRLLVINADGNDLETIAARASGCCPAWQPAAIEEQSPEPSVSPSAPDALTRGAAQFDPQDGIWVLTPLEWSFLVDPSGPYEPKTLFAVANYPIERGGDCAPTTALGALPADGALAWAIEYRDTQGNDFPVRPDRFSLDPSSLSNYECSGTHATYMLRFQDQGRYFQVHVALGEQASGDVRDEMLASLSSLVVDQCPPAEPPVLVSEFGSPIPDRGLAGGTVTLSGPTGRDENWFWSPLEKIEVWWSPERIGVPEETRDKLLLASIDPLSTCDFAVTFATPDVPAGRYLITILGYHEDGGFGLMGERTFTVTG